MSAWRFAAGWVAAACLAASGGAWAQHVPLPPVNLGGSSFTDAIGGPGVLVQEIVGWKPPAPVADGLTVSSLAGLTHVAVVLPHRVLGAWWGADALLPLAHVAVARDGAVERATGVGDLILNPVVLQWPRLEVAGRPFFQRLSLGGMVPTGAYRSSRALNTGSNVWSFNPYYSATVFLTDRLEASARLHYLWSSENSAPPAAYGAQSVQPGQAIHVNAAASYEVAAGVRIGVAAYGLAQVTQARVDGRPLQGSREQVIGVGPGIAVSVAGLQLVGNGFWELGARNRLAGPRFGLRLIKAFPLGAGD